MTSTLGSRASSRGSSTRTGAKEVTSRRCAAAARSPLIAAILVAQLTLTVIFICDGWIVQTYLKVPFFANVLAKVKPFLLEVAEPAAPEVGVTLCGTPPCVHLKTTLSPLWTLTVVGENALFLTATVFDVAAWAGTTAIAATRVVAAASLRIIGRSLGGVTTHPDARCAERIPPVCGRWPILPKPWARRSRPPRSRAR